MFAFRPWRQMRWLGEWCGQRNSLSSEFGGGEMSEENWEGAPSTAECNWERCYGSHAEVVPRKRWWPTVSRVPAGTEQSHAWSQGWQREAATQTGCLGRKKKKHSTSSPAFWTLLATVTEDSQCPDWAHPDCCRLGITGFQLAQTPACGVWRPFEMAGCQTLENPLSHICLITCNPHKTGPNTGSCFQK